MNKVKVTRIKPRDEHPKNRVEELLDELIKDKSPEELLGNEGLLKQLTKSLVERAMITQRTPLYESAPRRANAPLGLREERFVWK